MEYMRLVLEVGTASERIEKLLRIDVAG